MASAKPDSTDSPSWSADETVTALQHRRKTVRSYISGVIDRAKHGEHLNAFIRLFDDEALQAADHLDEAIAHGEPLPPLAGLAVVAKDNINLRNLPTTAGTSALRDARPATTALSLRKLIVAGAIVIGKTNMHELAFGITSTNLSPFAGPVHNPYDVDRIPGGSSGGTAVAIASGVVRCGLGTDTGGSTRIPAALTGIVGMRPSVGNGGKQRRYHDEGMVVPISHTRDTVGAMGRTVADVALLDSIIAERPVVRKAAHLKGIRLGVPPSLWSGLDASLEQVVLQARQNLTSAGVVFVDEEMPRLLELDNLLTNPIVTHEARTDIPAYLKASGIKGVTLEDIVHGIASPDVQGVFASVVNDTYGALYEEAINVHRPALQRLYADHFSKYKLDALFFPTTILPAAQIDLVHGSGNVSINGGPPVDTFGAYTRNASPGSNAGIPGLSIPAGLTREGLPVGLEIDGPVGSDEKLLSLGLAMEKIFGHLPPPEKARRS